MDSAQRPAPIIIGAGRFFIAEKRYFYILILQTLFLQITANLFRA